MKSTPELTTSKLYDVAYKCVLCGKLMVLGKPVELQYEQLPELCGRIIQNQLFAGNPWLHKAPMQVPCKCDNGSCGMAYFAGIIPIVKESR